MKKIIQTSKAPAPVGPYSQAVLAGDTLYISGQIGIDSSKALWVNDSIENETNQVLKNIRNILDEAGFSLDDVVKCAVFVRNMEDYGRINGVYLSFFGEENAPARELIEVTALPKYVNVEISAIAVK